jgi:cold shock protein
MSERLSGTVDHWVVDRGFCFIRLDDYAADVFCHVRDVNDFNGDRLEQGQRVSFVIEQGRDGKPKAARVVLLDLPDAA